MNTCPKVLTQGLPSTVSVSRCTALHRGQGRHILWQQQIERQLHHHVPSSLTFRSRRTHHALITWFTCTSIDSATLPELYVHSEGCTHSMLQSPELQQPSCMISCSVLSLFDAVHYSIAIFLLRPAHSIDSSLNHIFLFCPFLLCPNPFLSWHRPVSRFAIPVCFDSIPFFHCTALYYVNSTLNDPVKILLRIVLFGDPFAFSCSFLSLHSPFLSIHRLFLSYPFPHYPEQSLDRTSLSGTFFAFSSSVPFFVCAVRLLITFSWSIPASNHPGPCLLPIPLIHYYITSCPALLSLHSRTLVSSHSPVHLFHRMLSYGRSSLSNLRKNSTVKSSSTIFLTAGCWILPTACAAHQCARRVPKLVPGKRLAWWFLFPFDVNSFQAVLHFDTVKRARENLPTCTKWCLSTLESHQSS